MWKMLPLARKILKKKTKRVFEGSIAKKGEKIAKINPRKEKSCPKDALSLSSQQIFHPNTTAF
jgi:hypothetical protein